MRADLERIRLIEQYLNNELSPEGRAGFESQLESDASLREELQLQQDLQGGISRAGLKSGVKQAGRQFYRRNLLKKSLIGGAAAVVVASGGLWLLKPAHQVAAAPAPAVYVGTSLPELNEAGKRQWAMADSMIPAQVFNIDASRDTVIQSNGGMVLAIQAGSFVDNTGKPAAGQVSLCLKEALNASTIMTAGLSTTSDGKQLETGGMFFVDARNAAGILDINPAQPVYAEIPSKEAKPDMMLFKGQRLPNGNINWIDPKPLPNELMSVPVGSLDFYPPAYLTTLAENGYAASERRFTDSVYYSMAAWFAEHGSDSIERFAYQIKGTTVSDTAGAHAEDGRLYRECGINPASIKAIRSKRFENTLIGTREFAQRLPLIHKAHSQALLDLYLNNLDRNLFEIDSMAARQESPYAAEFAKFAALRSGKVRSDSKQVAMLREFYARQTRLFTEAVAKTQQSVRARQISRDREFRQRGDAHYEADLQRSSDMFADELVLNLEDAYRQLGYTKAPLVIIDPVTTAASIPSTGWFNVDKYVLEATTSRESMEYTDRESGKKATLTYEALEVGIAGNASYDRLLVYLLPGRLSSFIRLEEKNGRFSEKLNRLMKYDLVCLAYRGNERFIHVRRGIKAGTFSGIKLNAADAAAFEKQLSSLKPFGNAMSIREDAAFERFSLMHAAELKQRRAWSALMQKLRSVLFPCLERSESGEDERDVNRGTLLLPDLNTETYPPAGYQ
jgi:hypothetical protein